jgi:ribosomal-protein-serine acetyltransferase
VSRPFLDAGERVELRRLDLDDAEALQRVIDANRDRLRPWMWWADGSTVDTTRAFIQAANDNDVLDPLGISVDGELAGAMGATPETGTRNHEIGYWIGASHEGRGVVTRACRALITHLFAGGCHRVALTAGIGNTRSRAVAERLGFMYEGSLREAGHNENGFFDVAVYGLLESEWPPS